MDVSERCSKEDAIVLGNVSTKTLQMNTDRMIKEGLFIMFHVYDTKLIAKAIE